MVGREPAHRPPGDWLAALRPEALGAPESGIVEISNYGRDRPQIAPLWVGEGEAATPQFICDAAAASLTAGETFYTSQRGIAELRSAIARYMTRVYGSPFAGSATAFSSDRFCVTIGGMQAFAVAARMVAGSGDEVLVPTPAWPNFHGALAVVGARAVDVPMHLAGDGRAARWRLDVDELGAAINEKTRAIIINSPANPTGWTASLVEIEAILALARRHGLWIIADEIYGRIVFDGLRAPSFHDVMDAADRILFVQTTSKNWAMTGWRVGWIEAPPALGPVIANLVLYSSSGVFVPAQRAAIAALDHGEDFLAAQVRRMAESRAILCAGLAATGRARFAAPAGAFYVFCSVDGERDTREFCKRLVDEANVGVAPGAAFGTGAGDYVRISFSLDPERMRIATERLCRFLTK